MTERSVAILVDGDNFREIYAHKLIERAKGKGKIRAARVYCNARGQSGWDANSNFVTIHSGTGKNATDLLLAIDAMEFALKVENLAFVIASSDSDFTHLAFKLRELGKDVVWIGEAEKMSPNLSTIWCFETIGGAAPEANNSLDEIHQKVAKTITHHGSAKTGITVQQLGLQMNRAYGITKKDIPQKSWSKFLGGDTCRYEKTDKGFRIKV